MFVFLRRERRRDERERARACGYKVSKKRKQIMLVDKTFLADFETERVGGGRKSKKLRRELDEKVKERETKERERKRGRE